MWRIAWEVLPTKEFLSIRKQNVDPKCPRCSHPSKSLVHLLFECPFAIIVWRHTRFPINLSAIPRKSASNWIWAILYPCLIGLERSLAKSFTLIASIACDWIWRHRNKLIFFIMSPSTPLLLLMKFLKNLTPTMKLGSL